MGDIEEIYRQHADAVYRYLFSLSRDPDISDELTQETFYQAVRSVQRYDGTSKMTTWLFAIAKNVFYTYLRKHPDIAEIEENDSVTVSAESEYIKKESRLELLKRVHSLDDPYREVILLHVYAEMSYKDIAEIMERTENWVRVTFYRGKLMLRKEMGTDE